MATRLQVRLEQSRSQQRGILMGFLPAGYPNPDAFTDLVGGAFEAGLDALEVSMPSPPPGLDGPLIRAAANQACRYVADVPSALSLSAAARTSPEQTIVALAYNQVVNDLGPDRLLAELKKADIDALLLPEQSMANQIAIGTAAQSKGIEPVLFLHLQEDLEQLAGCDLVRPVIYLQSADLQTGGAFNQDKAIERLGELAQAFGKKDYWVVVGFGVRGVSEVTPLMDAGADGAIVGTQLVEAAGENVGAVALLVRGIMPALERHPVATR